MAEGTTSPSLSERRRSDDAPRGDRSPGPREGGFRIRLSDNEMRSARALQEAFGLRSTVAVLGFALRTLGQQLEEGKLEELVTLHRAQAGARGPGGGGRPEGRRERPEGRGQGGRWQESPGKGGRGAVRVDPFARPSRPVATPEAAEETSDEGGAPSQETVELASEQTAPVESMAQEADVTVQEPETTAQPEEAVASALTSDVLPETPEE